MRALRAIGIQPSLFHLNDGHPALAASELVKEAVDEGWSFSEAVPAARSRIVFTTHTPVPAGNETYGPDALLDMVGDLPGRPGVLDDELLSLGRAAGSDDGTSGMKAALNGGLNLSVLDGW